MGIICGARKRFLLLICVKEFEGKVLIYNRKYLEQTLTLPHAQHVDSEMQFNNLVRMTIVSKRAIIDSGMH
jgi:hypothetical protein